MKECQITLMADFRNLLEVRDKLCKAIERRGKGRILGTGMSLQMPGCALIEAEFPEVFEAEAFLERYEKRYSTIRDIDVEWPD